MHILSSLPEAERSIRSSVVAIGNFDGVHLGHQSLIRVLRETAEQKKLPSVILTFSPHPAKIIGNKDFNLIQTEEQKLDFLSQLGVDYTVVLPFHLNLASLSAHTFLHEVALQGLKASVLIVGENFRFGKNRKGNIHSLKKFGRDFKIETISVPSYIHGRIPVSSSTIRKLLLQGNFVAANQLLGRPYEITGTVVHGDSRGKALGFPTANIDTANEILPSGVFLTHAWLKNRRFPALTNIGFRPSFGKPSGGHSLKKNIQVETHILDFKSDLYSRRLKLSFLKRIRAENRFTSPQELQNQIKRDINSARSFFSMSG